MVDKEKVTRLIFESIDEINEQRPREKKLAKQTDAVLFGEGGALDSLSLVTLVIAIEQRVQENFDITIELANEKAMSQKNSPFRSVKSLADYLSVLLEEASVG